MFIRHGRVGHLFQNRFKSILCQEGPYLLELVRYIHLNPLRAKMVSDYPSLAKHAYCGHGVILGRKMNNWQDTQYVLALFGSNPANAKRNYREFVRKGIDMGKRPDLTGGGLLRSQGGWSGLKTNRRAGDYQKGDERIYPPSRFRPYSARANGSGAFQYFMLKLQALLPSWRCSENL